MPHLVSIIWMVLLLLPDTAWALQAHGEPEGLYVHQIAHVFFAFSMGLLIYWLRKWRLVEITGWRTIQYAALFFILWNLDAFAGHWLEERSELIEIQRAGLMKLRIITARGYEWLAPAYYLAKLDHLLSVPALALLFLGLRRLLRAPAAPEHREEGP